MNAHLVRRRLRRDARCAHEARQILEDALRDRVAHSALGVAKIVVSELVTNAYRHGRGPIELRVEWRGSRLRMEVADTGGGSPRLVDEPGSEGGWGLRIVERLSVDWGARGATRVWAEVALDR